MPSFKKMAPLNAFAISNVAQAKEGQRVRIFRSYIKPHTDAVATEAVKPLLRSTHKRAAVSK